MKYLETKTVKSLKQKVAIGVAGLGFAVLAPGSAVLFWAWFAKAFAVRPVPDAGLVGLAWLVWGIGVIIMIGGLVLRVASTPREVKESEEA